MNTLENASKILKLSMGGYYKSCGERQWDICESIRLVYEYREWGLYTKYSDYKILLDNQISI